MQFYDATNKRGICQEIDRLCDTTDTSYTRLDKTARANDALEELIGEIVVADGTFQYDDTNYTTSPRGKGNLEEGKASYSFVAEYLTIDQVDVLVGNLYTRLQPIDPEELGGLSAEQYFGVDASGNPAKSIPLYYDLLGDTITLYPAPAAASGVTLVDGLRVTFSRTAMLFTATSATTADTTEPGLPSPYHVLLAYMAAIPYCMTYKKDRFALYEKKKDELKKKLIAFYGLRDRDKRKTMTMKPINFI